MRSRRIRSRRHWANPLRWIPEQFWPVLMRGLIGTGVAGAAVAPAALVRQESITRQETAAETTGTKLWAQNESTKIALESAAALQDSVSVFRAQFAQFQDEMRRAKWREHDLRSRLPENQVGPAFTPWERHR